MVERDFKIKTISYSFLLSMERRSDNAPSHRRALDFVQGKTDHIPSPEQMEQVREGLYETVRHVVALNKTIAELSMQRNSLIAENQQLQKNIAAMTKSAPAPKISPSPDVEALSATKEEIIGHSTPCGQIMRITMPDGHDIFAQCICAGMPPFGGKCVLHAPKRASCSTSSAPVAQQTSSPIVAPVASYASAVKK
jgi:hypothetical protein